MPTLAVHDGHAVSQSLGSKDVGFLTIRIADQRDVGCSVGIVLDADDLCGDAVLDSPEINQSVFSSVSAAVMSDSDLTLIVASRILFDGLDK